MPRSRPHFFNVMFYFYFTYGEDAKEPLGSFDQGLYAPTPLLAIQSMMDVLKAKRSKIDWISLSRFKNNYRSKKNWEEACGMMVPVGYFNSNGEKLEEVPSQARIKFKAMANHESSPFIKYSERHSDYWVYMFYAMPINEPEQHQVQVNSAITVVSNWLTYRQLALGTMPDAGGFGLDLTVKYQR